MVRRVYRGYSPWREMRRMQHQMDRLVNQMGTGLAVAPSYPAMNVWVNSDGAVVTAELPGVGAADIDISVVQSTLTVSGDRQREEEERHRDPEHRPAPAEPGPVMQLVAVLALGVAATRRILDLVSSLTRDDTVVCLLSGGGSALNGREPRNG